MDAEEYNWQGIFLLTDTLILICESESDSIAFMAFLRENDFRIRIGSVDDKYFIEIDFLQLPLNIPFYIKDDKMFLLFRNGTIKFVTTGFLDPDGSILYNKPTIPLGHQDYSQSALS